MLQLAILCERSDCAGLRAKALFRHYIIRAATSAKIA